MTYSITVNETRKRPVIVRITQGGRLLHTIRTTTVEDGEAQAVRWISERTPKGV